MDCRINNKILGLLMVGCLAVFAYAAADTISSSGDLTLDPGGNNVLPGSDSTDSLGATNNVWSEVWTDNINSDGEISFKPSGDTDDYLSLETSGNIPYLVSKGGAYTRISSDAVPDITDAYMGIQVDEENTILYLKTDDAQGYIAQYNDTANSGELKIASDGNIYLVPTGGYIVNDGTVLLSGSTDPAIIETGNDNDMFFYVNDLAKFRIVAKTNDNNDYYFYGKNTVDDFQISVHNRTGGVNDRVNNATWFNSDGAIDKLILSTLSDGFDYIGPYQDDAMELGASNERFSDVHSVLINGEDICSEIGCWTETTNSYNESDMCWTYEKPTETQRNIIALWQHETYEDYIDSTGNPYKEDVYNEMRAKIVDDYGRPDFRLGRKITYCFNEIGRSQAAMELIIERLDISESEVKAKQRELEKPVVSVGKLKDKTGLNIITTTTTTSTTLTTFSLGAFGK